MREWGEDDGGGEPIRRKELRPIRLSGAWKGAGRNKCTSKKQYRTLAAARKAVRAMHRNNDPGRMEAYICPQCAEYHIGHSRRRA